MFNVLNISIKDKVTFKEDIQLDEEPNLNKNYLKSLKIKKINERKKNPYWSEIVTLYDKYNLITNHEIFIEKRYQTKQDTYNILLPEKNYGKVYFIYLEIFNKFPFLKEKSENIMIYHTAHYKNESKAYVIPSIFNRICIDFDIGNTFYNILTYIPKMKEKTEKFSYLQNIPGLKQFYDYPKKKNTINLIFINLISFKDSRYYFEHDMIQWIDFIFRAITQQKIGGNLIIYGNTIRKGHASLEILYLLSSCYENVYICQSNLVKLKSARLFVICENFKGGINNKLLISIVKKINRIKERKRTIRVNDINFEIKWDKYIYNIFKWSKPPLNKWKNKIINYNKSIYTKIEKNIQNIQNVIDLYEKMSLYERINLKKFLFFRQVKWCTKWCNINNIKIKEYYKSKDYLNYIDNDKNILVDYFSDNIQIDKIIFYMGTDITNQLTYENIKIITNIIYSKFTNPSHVIVSHIFSTIGNYDLVFLNYFKYINIFQNSPTQKHVLKNNLNLSIYKKYDICNDIYDMKTKQNMIFMDLSLMRYKYHYINKIDLQTFINIMYTDVMLFCIIFNNNYDLNKLKKNSIYENIEIYNIQDKQIFIAYYENYLML